MTTTDDYLAGFFDGEGCIGMYMRRAWTLQVTVSQKDHVILDLFDERFPGASWNHFKNVTNLVWYGLHAYDILQVLSPKLVLKNGQAQLALKFIEMQLAHRRGTSWSTEERIVIDDLAQRIKTSKKIWDRTQRGI